MAEFDFDGLDEIEKEKDEKHVAVKPNEDLKAAEKAVDKTTPPALDTNTSKRADIIPENQNVTVKPKEDVKATESPKPPTVESKTLKEPEPVATGTKISNGNDYESSANGTDGHIWEVVGGRDTGGIVVRESWRLTSPELPQRLATSSLVKKMDVKGERLHYKLLSGTGPDMGWISMKSKGNVIVKETSKRAPNEDAKAKDTDYAKAKTVESELPKPAAPAKMSKVPEETPTPLVEKPFPPVETKVVATPPVEPPTPPTEKKVSAKSCEEDEKTPLLDETPARKSITFADNISFVEGTASEQNKGLHPVLVVGSIVVTAIAVIFAVRYLKK